MFLAVKDGVPLSGCVLEPLDLEARLTFHGMNLGLEKEKSMRLRQVVLVARELDPLVDTLCEVFQLKVGFNDPGVGEFGLQNAVLPVGDTFLEVVSPVAEGTTAGRFLDRRGGDGGYMVIVQVEDVAAARRRVQELGVRVVWSAEHEDIQGTHLHPRDVGGAILSLDEATPPESWRWGGPDWPAAVVTARVREITAVELQATDPFAMARRWSQVLERPLSQGATGGESTPRIELDRGAIRFVPAQDGRGDGLRGFDLAAVDPQAVLDAARTRRLPVEGQHVVVGGVRVSLVS